MVRGVFFEMASIKNLKQIARICAGYPFRGKIVENASSANRVVQMKDVTENFTVRWDTLVHANPEGKRAPDWLGAEDILFIAKGNNNIAIYLESVPGNVVCSPQFYLLQSKTMDILPEYLAWAVNQKPAQDYLRKNREGSGTQSVRRGVLEDMPIVVPSLVTQTEIIALNQLVRKENNTFEALRRNRQLMMNSLAYSLFD